jgi:hypothetical protein
MKLIIGKAVDAAVVLICHFLLAALLVLTGHGIEWLVDFIGGPSLADPMHGPQLIFDLVPLKYLFQAIDVAMIALFGYMGLTEAYGVLK